MSARHPPSPIRRCVVLGAAALCLFGGCSSSRQLESIESQLGQISGQIATLQTELSSKQEVAELEGRVLEETERLLRSEADTRLDIGQLSNRISELEAQLADTLYRIDQLSQQIARTNQELEALLAAIPAGGEGAGPPSIADPVLLYEEAYADFRNQNYDLAIVGFREYIDTFPETELADNALYWLGECYFNRGKFAQAVAEFSGVLSRYPRSERVVSAMLRRGLAYLAMGESEEGLNQLERLVRDYPSSEEADIAREQLQELQNN